MFPRTGARRAGAVEGGRGDVRGRRTPRRVEGTARERGHVRGAQTVREGRGEQVREEVQVVRRVTGDGRAGAAALRLRRARAEQ